MSAETAGISRSWACGRYTCTLTMPRRCNGLGRRHMLIGTCCFLARTALCSARSGCFPLCGWRSQAVVCSSPINVLETEPQRRFRLLVAYFPSKPPLFPRRHLRTGNPFTASSIARKEHHHELAIPLSGHSDKR